VVREGKGQGDICQLGAYPGYKTWFLSNICAYQEASRTYLSSKQSNTKHLCARLSIGNIGFNSHRNISKAGELSH
jgi:DNA polymerase III epsilon subunit-like protein